jgi:hypothetical protein
MLKEYQTQNTLNPLLWDGDNLKPRLAEKFIRIANHFYDFLEIEAPIIDIILIGSNANYNWTKHSDIDLHVIINYLEAGDNLHLVQQYLQAKKSIWNTNYPLKFKGMNIELYAQDSNDNLHSTVGVYSLGHNKWIYKPSANIITIDDDIIEQKSSPYEFEIDSLKEDDPKLEYKLKNILERLRNLRQTGLDASGEYSIENLAYKHLRNKGYISKVKELLQKTMLGKLQIEESVIESLANHVNKQQTLDESGWAMIIKQTGGIEDAQGQWNHPGRCTMIPSNQITMQNVPHKVLGIDDTGHMQMMQPEQQYSYPGNKVFEIPMTAQHKTWLVQLMNRIRNGSKYAE